ncbi:MAG: hypothetical protein PHH55_09465, partial [Candidatus Delongbacteria bacterium]|nr:hypothetical protein [Candidatus Delongbacteria bacterium]
MKKVFDKDNFLEYFSNRKSFSIKELNDYFIRINPDVKNGTLSWRVYDLISKGIITRIGRGIYSLGSERKFVHSISNLQRKISNEIKRKFPYAKYCIWNLSVIKEFLQHIFGINFLIVEVEREAVQSVYNSLKETNSNVFYEPKENLIEEYVINIRNPVILKNLVSEAPVTEQERVPVPDLEKILVDIFSDKELFYFIQGNEKFNIFRNAINKYTLNYDKLNRYAKRRNSYDIIADASNQRNGNK